VASHFFDRLTPDAVLDALDAVGLRGDGRLLQLNSYENRVFQVMLEDGSAVVAKFYRPGRWSDAQIVEEHRFALELAAAEVPVVTPLLLPGSPPQTLAIRSAIDADGAAVIQRYAVSPRHAGRSPDLEDIEVLERLGGFIGRLHAVGRRAAFEHRTSLDPVIDTRKALDRLDPALPPDQAGPWRAVTRMALDRIEAACGAVGARNIRLHGDCHRGNLLWRDEGARTGVHVVDLDDCCAGPAVQDLWMLLSGEPAAAAQQMGALLRGYERFAHFDRRELRLIDALRLTRMIRHNAWVAQRFDDPAFEAAWPDFGSSAYWAQQCVQLHEQLRLATETPTLDTLI
jgi:Ser/Thr protein kinase RdoA (MazF antagonist)